MSVLIVGSIALDTVKTPVEEHADQLGGSASYAALGASFFSPVKLVGVVGDDFPAAEFEFWKTRGIDAEGVQKVTGKTFRWSGEYAWDMNTRETRSVDLNVFEHFRPDLPASYRTTDFVLLANIAPALQSHVLDQMEKPRFVVADTMDLWIEIARADLDALLPRVDLLILNDSEAREMTKETSLIKAGRRIRRSRSALRRDQERRTRRAALWRRRILQLRRLSTGRHPRSDRGRGHLRGRDGWLSRRHAGGELNFAAFRRAMIYGSVLASFNVEAFSLERLRTLTKEEIAARYEVFRSMSQFDVDCLTLREVLSEFSFVRRALIAAGCPCSRHRSAFGARTLARFCKIVAKSRTIRTTATAFT